MMEPINAGIYVLLGEIVHYCRAPAIAPPAEYAAHIDALRTQLSACGFCAASAGAKQLGGRTLPQSPVGLIASPTHLQLTEIVETVAKVLYNEADNRQTIAIDASEVSKRLRDLPGLLPTGRPLTDSQTELMDEAIRCIECGAYRAAAVIGWNLAYDYIRTWVLDSGHLDNLNAGLSRVCPQKTPITYYCDFFDKDAPIERNVIDALAHQESGPIINGELHDHLVQYLRYRNRYAHATAKAASAAKTNAYVEHLIDIITTSPFA
jgi:hypothetical protein